MKQANDALKKEVTDKLFISQKNHEKRGNWLTVYKPEKSKNIAWIDIFWNTWMQVQRLGYTEMNQTDEYDLITLLIPVWMPAKSARKVGKASCHCSGQIDELAGMFCVTEHLHLYGQHYYWM